MIYIIEFINIFLLVAVLIIVFNNNYNIDYFENNNRLNYKVYYINLENRLDRRKQILNEFKKCNIDNNYIYQIVAVKKELGLYGCLLSHIKTLEKAIKDNVDYAVIFEDDFIFRKKIDINSLINNIKDLEWDVCLLSGNTIKLLDKLDDNLYKVNNSQTTSGYIIKKKYIPVLLNFWNKTNLGDNRNIDYSKLSKMDCSNSVGCPYNSPLDISWKKLQKKDNWIIFYPTIGYQGDSFSDILKRNVNYGV